MAKRLHPLVEKTKLDLKKLDQNKEITWGERRSYRGSFLPISVEPKLRPRAFSFMNDLIVLLEKNGHSIKFEYNRCHIEIYGQLTKFTLRQKFYRKRVTEEGYSYPHNIFVKSEDLEFKILDYPRKIWIDKKTKNLEHYLIKIYEYVENESKRMFKLRETQKIEEKKRENQRKLEEEKSRLISIENKKFENLLSKVSNYNKANKIRNYLKAVKKKYNSSEVKDQNLLDYIKWATKKANEIDPLFDED